jgi:hypothetical protein
MASTVGAASRSWLLENIGLMPKIIVTPVTIYQPALSGLLSGFPDRILSGCHRFSTGHPDLRVAEVTAIGGTRATGWSPVSRSACSRYFRVFDQAQPA